jgi:ABC-2 type transport system permease protein
MEGHKMNNLPDMVWIEWRKAIRSRIPLWTAVGSLFMPVGIAFLIFVSKNPEIAKNLGLISVKANLFAYSATDWTTYLGLAGQMIAAGGFFMFVIVFSWVFGREFTDGTIKDMLAVPVSRWTIVLAKFIISTVLSIAMILVILIISLTLGLIIQLPHGSLGLITQGGSVVLITGLMVIVVVIPFALLASIGRGYLLPLGLAILTLIFANILAIAGWGELFPWCIPGLFAQGKTTLSPISFWIVLITGLLGIMATYLWWKYSDQNR